MKRMNWTKSFSNVAGDIGPSGTLGTQGPPGPKGQKGQKGKGLCGVKYVRGEAGQAVVEMLRLCTQVSALCTIWIIARILKQNVEHEKTCLKIEVESCLILLESNISSMKILYRSEFSLANIFEGKRVKEPRW